MATSLPTKEANLFKTVVRSYETKQYKKGLKAADSILKKFPDHGETLAMKGLIFNCMDRKEDAHDLVRQGLKNNLKSHVCWHVYGLLHRSNRDYREAIKCYLNALKIDPENFQILRDLSLLQAQMRDLVGFVETRRQLLTLKPNNRNNWIGFAVAHHLNSNPGKAAEILEAYEGTQEGDYPPDNERYEHSEMLLYKVFLLVECEAPERAVQELKQKETKIVDKLGFKVELAGLLLTLGRFEEAEETYRSLLSLNSDNYRYLEGLHKSIGLSAENGCHSPEEVEKLIALYESLKQQYPSSAAVRRIPLDFLEKDDFRRAADSYIRPFLTKGIPSLFSDLLPIYNNPEKSDILEDIFLEIESSLKISGSVPVRPEKELPSTLMKEPPSTLMWTQFFLAQHYDQRRHYEAALAKIDEAIAHKMDVIDLYLVKGRILKHAGDQKAAAALANEARTMDLADRFINSECVKRMLQADQVELAERTAVLFTKDGDQHNSLHDMQCIWYELASADSHFRQGALGPALKNYLAVEKHYTDMVEDQFDFHTYCLRKMTLRSYVQMLKFQDHLHSYPYFHKASIGAIRCYLKLYDSPPKTTVEEEVAIIGLPSSERKRLRQKQRKAEARAKKEAEEKAKEEEASSSAATKSGKRLPQQAKAVDIDPNGEKLLQVEDPLIEGTKYLQLLKEHSSKSLETYLLAFELYMRKQKILLALQALKRQLDIEADNPDVHRCLIRFFGKVRNLPPPETLSEKLVQRVIETEETFLEVLQGKSLLEVNENFYRRHKDSLLHRAAAAEMLYFLEPKNKEEAINIIEDSVNNTLPRYGALVGEWKLKDCVAVHKLLEMTLKDVDAASRWRVRCAEYFPYSTYFKGQKSSAVSRSVNSDICSKAENGDFHKNQAEDLISVNGDSLDLKGLRITSPDKPDQIC